ncbi:MAG TPA: sodium:proton antiporter [Marinagarivorans sp.]
MTTPLIMAMIAVVALASQWTAWYTKLPAILFLLLAGIVLGPGLDILDPDEVFGDLLFPLISLSVAVILFEGSLTLRFGELKKLGTVVHRLVTVGALVSWLVVSIAVHYLFDANWGISILLGAITVVTGPTVIVPLLRTVRPRAQVASVLRWEGIVIDPIGALLAVVVFEFIVTASEGHALTHSLWLFFRVIFWGLCLGGLGGFFLGVVLKRRLLPDYLLNLATLTFVFAVFTGSNALAHESGLLAVTVMGMWLANTRGIHIEEILNFKENLTIVLISGLFIILAARIDPNQLLLLGTPVILLLLVLQFVARPLSVLASTVKTSLSWRERALLAWIAPRGIVAAAVSAIFALRLEEAGVPQAELLVPITFSIIIGTVLVQSLTARLVAKGLGVAESAPRGYLIIGANSVARTLAKSLRDLDFRVLLTDSSWDNIRAARMDGLDTFYGNPVSEYADRKLELVGIGRLLCLSPHRELNVVASMRYRSEFGKDELYTLRSSSDTQATEKHQIAADHRGHTLFNVDMTYGKLASLLSKGAEIRKTKLSAEFTFDDLLAQGDGQITPLYALSPKGRLSLFVEGGDLKPAAGWVVLSLVSARKVAEKAADKAADKKNEQTEQDSAADKPAPSRG